jgi:polyphosphate glucokinase
MQDIILGIDVGGSGLKGALVNIKTGEFVTEKFRLPTPKPATTEAVAETFKSIVEHFNWKGPIGCGVPAVVHNGITKTAANIDKSFVNANIQSIFSKACGCDVLVLNDADAAGIAELNFGAAEGKNGTIIMLTLGTGIGSALFTDGVLIQNTEFGHLKFENSVAEKYCADSIRKNEDLSWKDYGKRLNKFLLHIEHLFSPDLILLGGGGSKHFQKFEDHLKLTYSKVKPAQLLNEAGIIGAAYFAYYKLERHS